jgi:hypothetical protein
VKIGALVLPSPLYVRLHWQIKPECKKQTPPWHGVLRGC